MRTLIPEGFGFFIVAWNRLWFLSEEEFFLVRKILVNVRILWDPFHIEILLTRVNCEAQDISIWGFLGAT